MPISYRQFLQTVLEAAGPFGYRFHGEVYICDPTLYIPIRWGSREKLMTANQMWLEHVTL